MIIKNVIDICVQPCVLDKDFDEIAPAYYLITLASPDGEQEGVMYIPLTACIYFKSTTTVLIEQ